MSKRNTMDDSADLWAPLSQFVKMHASYFPLFKDVINLLFYEEGPLPYNIRHYLAIMAAARHKCQFLVDVHRAEFIRHMGPENWLDGLHNASMKVRNFDLTNRIAAHRPWLLQVSHLKKLSAPPNSWSLGEMVQAALIVCHTHALASLVNGCGVGSLTAMPSRRVLAQANVSSAGRAVQRSRTPNGSPSGRKTPAATAVPASKEPIMNGSPKTISSPGSLNKCRSFSDEPKKSSTTTSQQQQQQKKHGGQKMSPSDIIDVERLMVCMQMLNEKPAETNLEYFITVNQQNCEINPVTDGFKDTSDFKTVSKTDDQFSKFTEESEFVYSEFFRKSDGLATPILSIHEFSWEDQGYSVVNEFYSEASDILDEKFKLIQDLTYHTMGGHKNVDTTKFRTAVWNYIQTLFGIRHDDYDYREIGHLLSRQMKAYIKTLCCHPERMRDALRNSVMTDFLFSEKMHVNLLIFEGRFQAEALHLLRTILSFWQCNF